MKFKKKLPMSYYGGKQHIAPWIISHFPENYPELHYIEPFAGGLAVLFNKKISKCESISDTEKNIYCFWRVFSDEKKVRNLQSRLEKILHHEYLHNQAKEKLKSRFLSDTDRAFYYFIAVQIAFSNIFNGSFFFKKRALSKRNMTGRVFNKLKFFDHFHKRMKCVQIFNRPAYKIIKLLDNPDALFYLDPPYPDALQGYEKKFSNEEFNKMIELLKNIKGKFILSCYETDWMDLDPKWVKSYKKTIAWTKKTEKYDSKSFRKECLIMNYTPGHGQQLELLK